MHKPSYRILCVAAAMALVLPGDSILYAVLPSYYPRLGLSPIEVGILLSANRWVRLVSNLVAERCFRQPRAEYWLVVALLIGSLVMVIYGTFTAFWVLLAARIVWGISFSFIRQAGIMTVVGASRRGYLATNMGYFNSLTAAGGIAGVLLGGLGHDTIGLTWTLLAFFAVSLAAIPLGYISQRGFSLPRPAATGPATGEANWRFMCYGFAVGMVGPGLVYSTLGLVLKERLGDQVKLFGLVLGIATLSGIVLSFQRILDGFCSPVLGAIGDRFGRERLVPAAFLIGAMGLGLAGYSSGAVGILVGVLVLFGSSTLLIILLNAWAGQKGARTASVFFTASDFGSGIGPLIGWGITQLTLAPVWILLSGTVVYGMGFLLSRKQD
ncbi:MAG: MFS transporter [SAR324 cluster bacterium]|nr:MFS transporter [SAR324 cluster bacterium]